MPPIYDSLIEPGHDGWTWLIRQRWMPLAEQIQFRHVRLEEKGDRPVEHDPHPPAPARHLKQVIGSPDPPGEEPTDAHLHDPSDALVTPEAGEHAQRAVDERLERRVGRADGAGDVAGQHPRLAPGV